MEEEGWLGIRWIVSLNCENGPCWCKSEDFAVKAPLGEAEAGGRGPRTVSLSAEKIYTALS